ENKVVDLQKALGMEETATTLDKRADGLFGQRSLKNLEAGKIIEYVISGNATGGNKKDIPSSAKKINTIKGDPSTQHLVGPNYEGEYNPLPGYHFKNKEANDYTTIENVKPTYEEAIKNPTVYNLTYDVSTGELKPAKNYIWLNEGEDDFRAIPNQYDLKTRSINDLVDIAFSKKTLTEAEYKLLNKYDLMIIYSSNPKFKFNKEVTQDDKIIKTTVTPEVKNGSTNKIGEKVFDNYEDQVKEYVSTISGIQLQTAISENPYLYIAESTTWNTVEKINMNTYIKDGVLDMVSLKKTIDGIKTRIDNLNKTIETLRGKSYSATDIFGTDKKFQTDVYKTFFKKFKDNNVLIDESPTYTFYSITSGKAIYYSTLQFDLDQKGAWDDSYCKGLIIDVVNDKVINKDGTLNEDELKKFLAKKITAIIKDPENEYV
ncbi:MAG: hypothetical protein NT085_02985, partial [candidate division SR1 bacterium]|nr:hypothetical protein [candidate division SR1 bacterium]